MCSVSVPVTPSSDARGTGRMEASDAFDPRALSILQEHAAEITLVGGEGEIGEADSTFSPRPLARIRRQRAGSGDILLRCSVRAVLRVSGGRDDESRGRTTDVMVSGPNHVHVERKRPPAMMGHRIRRCVAVLGAYCDMLPGTL